MPVGHDELMADLSAVAASAEAPVPARPRRDRWLIGAVVAVVALPILVWAAWTVLAGRAADDVDATWSLRCPGARVGSYEGERATFSRPGWRCEVVLRISNQGDRDVRLGEVRSPILGPGGGGEIQALGSADAEVKGEGGDEIDAVWEVDLDVPAHETRTVTLAIGWRQDGCNSGGWLSLENWPTIELETTGRSIERDLEQTLVLRTFDDPHDERACRDG